MAHALSFYPLSYLKHQDRSCRDLPEGVDRSDRKQTVSEDRTVRCLEVFVNIKTGGDILFLRKNSILYFISGNISVEVLWV